MMRVSFGNQMMLAEGSCSKVVGLKYWGKFSESSQLRHGYAVSLLFMLSFLQHTLQVCRPEYKVSGQKFQEASVCVC